MNLNLGQALALQLVTTMSIWNSKFYSSFVCAPSKVWGCLFNAHASDNFHLGSHDPKQLKEQSDFENLSFLKIIIQIAFLLSAQLGMANETLHGKRECGTMLGGTAKKLSPVQENNFTNSRVLADYNNFFNWKNFDLMKVLENLRSHSIWIDMGSGRNIALVKGLSLFNQIGLGIGINAVKPEFALNDERVPGRLKNLEGMIEDLSEQKKFDALKGKVDLITDVFGPFSYSLKLRKVMQIYLDLIAKDGQLLMAFQIARAENKSIFDDRNDFDLYNAVKSENKWQQNGLIEWLKTIPGIQVESVEQKVLENGKSYDLTVGVRIIKLDSTIEVPDTIEYVDHIETVPYRRLFQRR